MNKNQIITSLNKIANKLDNSGFYNEANTITNLMKKLSQNDETAEEIPSLLSGTFKDMTNIYKKEIVGILNQFGFHGSKGKLIIEILINYFSNPEMKKEILKSYEDKQLNDSETNDGNFDINNGTIITILEILKAAQSFQEYYRINDDDMLKMTKQLLDF